MTSVAELGSHGAIVAENKSPLEHPVPSDGEEQDLLFKAQMWLYDLVVTKWKLVAVAAGLVLLGSLFYGMYDSWQTSRARDGAALIAAIDRTLPEIDQMAMMGLVPLDNLSDPKRVDTLTKAANAYEEAADKSSGAAAAHGWLKAAETWQRLGNTEKAKAAFTEALSVRKDDIFGYSAHMGLAAIAMSEGKADEAEAHITAAAKDKGFLGESALLALVDMKVQAGDSAGAQKALDEARTRYPTSPRVEEAAQTRGLTLAAVPAPTDKTGG